MFSQLTYTNAFAVIAKVLSFTRSANILLEGTLVSKVGQEDAKYDPKLRMVPWLVKFVYPHGDGLIAKSADVLRDVREIIGNRLDGIKIRVLPNPYCVEGIRSLAKEPVAHHWLGGNKIPVIVSAGRLVGQKAFDILISAFAGVVSEMACRLIILGVGPERENLEGLAGKLGVAHHMDMPGWVANPWKYMWRASAFVLPSRYEGWPSAVTEAMICGLPVITTDCPGGGKEMVENEKNGLTVPTDDVDALKQAMLRLLSDAELRAMLAANAYKSSEKYDYRIVAQDYICFGKWVLTKS
jgi:glycosyltransferase involved in cell wall biosynthesis